MLWSEKIQGKQRHLSGFLTVDLTFRYIEMWSIKAVIEILLNRDVKYISDGAGQTIDRDFTALAVVNVG